MQGILCTLLYWEILLLSVYHVSRFSLYSYPKGSYILVRTKEQREQERLY